MVSNWHPGSITLVLSLRRPPNASSTAWALLTWEYIPSKFNFIHRSASWCERSCRLTLLLEKLVQETTEWIGGGQGWQSSAVSTWLSSLCPRRWTPQCFWNSFMRKYVLPFVSLDSYVFVIYSVLIFNPIVIYTHIHMYKFEIIYPCFLLYIVLFVLWFFLYYRSFIVLFFLGYFFYILHHILFLFFLLFLYLK